MHLFKPLASCYFSSLLASGLPFTLCNRFVLNADRDTNESVTHHNIGSCRSSSRSTQQQPQPSKHSLSTAVRRKLFRLKIYLDISFVKFSVSNGPLPISFYFLLNKIIDDLIQTRVS